MNYAQTVFTHIPNPNTFSYNTMIRGLSHSNLSLQAIALYTQMLAHGISPDNYTYPFLLKAFRLGFESDGFVLRSLVHMYAQCGLRSFAEQIFDEMPQRNIV
ncbi:hypothetical protein AMTRI_Chr02g222290 [Amborella trichopoda]